VAVLRSTIALGSEPTPDRARFQRDGVDVALVALHCPYLNAKRAKERDTGW
jgi:hypothetical protein